MVVQIEDVINSLSQMEAEKVHPHMNLNSIWSCWNESGLEELARLASQWPDGLKK